MPPLTAMGVYKNLPKTNCGECGFPTCMAFAMQVGAKQKALTDCPKLSDQAKAELADVSAPPMKLVRIGPATGGVEIGQETVMFRHEEKFQKPAALAVKIAASLSDSEALERVERINKAVFTRVGQELSVKLAAIELDGIGPDKAGARVKALAQKSRAAFVLMSENADVMHAAVSAIADKTPLIYKATEKNAEMFVKIAAGHKCPLAVSADSLEKLADIAKSAKDSGVSDIILSFDGRKTAETVRNITIARRAALRKGFRALGYPSMVDVSGDNAIKETVLASEFVAKYASVIIINGLDGSELMPMLTMIQNIYTNPQVPNEVEATLHEVGNVNENSPVLFTTNFALTYFCVEGEVERSKIPAYISVVDTEGLGVLNAYAGDKLSPEKVIKTMEEQKVADKVRHRKLIIPGLLPSFRAEIEESSQWKEVMIGPENASGLPAFFAKNWK